MAVRGGQPELARWRRVLPSGHGKLQASAFSGCVSCGGSIGHTCARLSTAYSPRDKIVDMSRGRPISQGQVHQEASGAEASCREISRGAGIHRYSARGGQSVELGEEPFKVFGAFVPPTGPPRWR